jgi:predicted GIY-YIG superfamily endonuclease
MARTLDEVIASLPEGERAEIEARARELIAQEMSQVRRTVKFNKSGIETLPNHKPVVYIIETAGGSPNYIGVARRGSVQERLQEHLARAKDPVPGFAVRIEQFDTIAAARRRERELVACEKPKYNRQAW